MSLLLGVHCVCGWVDGWVGGWVGVLGGGEVAGRERVNLVSPTSTQLPFLVLLIAATT